MIQTEIGAILAAVAVVVGARAGEHFGWAGVTGPAIGLVLTAPLAILLPARFLTAHPTPGSAKVAGGVLLAAVACVAMARGRSGLVEGTPARLAAAEVEGRVVVRLTTDPQGRWTGVRVPARVEVVDGRRAGGTVLVVAKAPAAERLRLLEAGESVGLVGRFRGMDAGERQWRWRHVAAVFEARDLVAAGAAEPGLLRAANGLRHRVLAGGDALGDTDRALVAGFLVGDDRDLPPAVAADFRASGLSHLLVVSGANVTLVLAFVTPLLQRFGLLGRLVGGVAVLVVFGAMTRFEPSVLRAEVMSGLSLLAAFAGRPAAGLRLLALAVSGLVLLDPFLVHSLGFGLSCGASAGILLLAGPLAQRIPGPRWAREPLAVTAAAQIGVAPIALPAFGHLPLATLPANLAAAPAAAALSVWGLASGVAGGLLGSANGGPVALVHVPTATLAGWIRAVAHVAAACPVTIGPRGAALLAVVMVMLLRRSGTGADAVPLGGERIARGRLLQGIDLEAEPVVERQQSRAGQEERGGGHGVAQIELEPVTARLAEHAAVPFHLGDDPQELAGGQRAPEPGEQTQGEADAAHQLDDDRGPA